MTNQTRILAAFAEADTIIIHRHVNPDPDAIGSQTGLALVLKHAYPEKTILTVGPTPANLAWIGGADSVDDAAYKDALVVVIDTANLARIADDRYQTGKMVVKIDHHPDREPFGDLSWVNQHASSSSEMVVDLVAESSGQLHLTKQAAAALYAGIIGDTGRFLFDLATAHTHEVAAQLLATGIDAPAIGRQEDSVSVNIGRLWGWALSHVTITANHSASLIMHRSDLTAFDLAPGEEQRAVGIIGKLAEVDAWAVFTEREDGRFRVELRGKTVSINPLAVAHGGGGHPLASGAIADDLTEVTAIIAELDQLVASV